MLQQNLVLKHNELYLVGDSQGDGSGERATGLYARDTRFLNCWQLRVNDAPLEPLDARVLGPDRAVVICANGAVTADGRASAEAIRPLSVAVEQHVQLDTALRVGITLGNYSGQFLSLPLSLEIGADFRDMFEIRGFPRPARAGAYEPPTWRDGQLTFAYRDSSGATTELHVDFSQPPLFAQATAVPEAPQIASRTLLPGFDEVLSAGPEGEVPRDRVFFDVALGAGETWELTVTLTPVPAAGPAISTTEEAEELAGNPRRARIITDHAALNRTIARAAADLAMLHTSFPDGRLVAAGIPWFVAPFGRDSLIVSLQTLHLAPARAAETLRTLAALQGERVDPFREEEPGKILHEMRYGEMARLAEIPHTPYYGSIDATPLFVMLFAETVRWTGDRALYDELLPHVKRAVQWMEEFGDRDGDGLIEYSTEVGGSTHIAHQGWKDSHDSLHDAAGRPITGEIALVEVQGYAYAAYHWLAEAAHLFGDSAWSAALAARAERLRAIVEERFWLPEAGFYAQALDGNKRPVAALTSNAGHLLYCGVPSRERAQSLAARLREPELDSGWGVRTLAADVVSYNPMSYHNGSVWPHDNSLIAAGLARYGEEAGLERIASAIFAAAERFPLQRLPELYCGFARDEDAADAPVRYPVGCSPQAWAAGAVLLLVRAMLGLEADAERDVLRVRPRLPTWINRVAIIGMNCLGQQFDLAVERVPSGFRVESEGPAELA